MGDSPQKVYGPLFQRTMLLEKSGAAIVGCAFASEPTRLQMPLASIIVFCKGRLHHLRQTLPNMLAQVCAFEFEVIVLDYDCPQDTFNWCRSLLNSSPSGRGQGEGVHLIAVRVVAGTEFFNLSHARNCGAVHSAAQVLAYVDADARLAPRWLAAAVGEIVSGRAGLCRPANLRGCPDWAGTCTISAALFHQVLGYDEGCQGWGLADADLYRRATRLAPCAWYAPGLVWPIRHDDQSRTAHYAQRSILASAERNSECIVSDEVRQLGS